MAKYIRPRLMPPKQWLTTAYWKKEFRTTYYLKINDKVCRRVGKSRIHARFLARTARRNGQKAKIVAL